MEKRPYAYDIEQYPNYHCSTWIDILTDDVQFFEIHTQSTKEDIKNYRNFLLTKVSVGIGFNNLEYDYPMLHHFIENVKPHHTGDQINKALKRYNDHIFSLEKKHTIRVQKPLFPQVDLFRIHHYNNKNKSQSLKGLQFELGEKVVMETPISFDKFISLNNNDREIIKEYNYSDTITTKNFYFKTLDKIELRKNLSRQFNMNLINDSDSSIGEKILLKLYEEKTGKHKYEIQQTLHYQFPLSELILPYISFKTERYGDILKAFQCRYYNGKKIEFENKIDKITYSFGLGGIHAARKGIFKTDEEYIVYDLDVSGFYPSLAIANNFYITQFGEPFVDILKYIVDTRRKNKKLIKDESIPEKERKAAAVISDGFKLASNSIYGKSSDQYSKLFDIKYTYKTTINGQLSLLMLIETLVENMEKPFKVLQANTDGFTVLIHKSELNKCKELSRKWEKITGLELEDAYYKSVFIRDVNNYFSIDEKGKIKAKGAYELDKVVGNEVIYSKNSSFRIITQAVHDFLIKNIPVEETIYNCKEVRHFLGRQKFNKDFRGVIRFFENKSIIENPIEIETEKVTRYYVTKHSDYETGSGRFFRIKKENNTETTIHVGYNVRMMQHLTNEIPDDLNYQFYIDEAIKLINPLFSGEQNFN